MERELDTEIEELPHKEEPTAIIEKLMLLAALFLIVVIIALLGTLAFPPGRSFVDFYPGLK